MPSPSRKRQDVEASLETLTLSPSSHIPSSTRLSNPASPIADSWEEAAISSSSSSPSPSTSPPPTPASSTPPSSSTPRSPRPSPPTQNKSSISLPPPYPHASTSSPHASASSPHARRPEKSTAVAGRLIAGALGVRAPKKTEEQKAYEKAVREKEARRIRREREARREEEEERERARRAVWEG